MERDVVVTCPYNKAHRIRRYKLMSHMVKCKKQHDTTNKATCPLNSSHVVDHSDMRDHLSSCPNLSCLIQKNIEEKVDVAPMDVDTHKSVENWDETPEIPTYDAIANAATKKVIRCVSGLTKSERQKYRLNEQNRFANLTAVNPTTERAGPLQKETIHEVAVRPPCDITQAESNTKVSQQKSKKCAQEQDSNANLTKSTTTDEFRDIFQKTLYNELLPDYKPDDSWRDNTFFDENQYVKSEDSVRTNNILQKLLEHSMSSNDTLYKSFDHLSSSPGPSTRNQIKMSEKESRKEKNVSFSDQNQEVKNKNKQEDLIEVDTVCDIFSANTSKREIKYTENTRDANISSEKVTDKLLALLMDKTEKMKLEMKENDEEDESRNLSAKWENLIDKLSDRLDHLTNAQSAAAEQSARLAKEVSDLKQLKSCCNTQPSAILNNPRCAATFVEQMPSLNQMYPKNHNVFQEAPTFLKNTPSSYNENRDNNMFSLRDNSESPKLKTPKDFSRC